MVDVEAEFNPVIAKAFDCEIRKRLCPGGVAQWTSASEDQGSNTAGE
jgi:hypothetical protein